MASSADDLAARVAEALEEPLLVAIGAACSTPTETANKCQELGLTTEGEKLAKWVAVLKRDSQTLFGADFLSKLKEISDAKLEEKMKCKIYTFTLLGGGEIENAEQIRNLQRKVNSFVKNHPESKIEWKQSSSAGKWKAYTQMTAVVSY